MRHVEPLRVWARGVGAIGPEVDQLEDAEAWICVAEGERVLARAGEVDCVVLYQRHLGVVGVLPPECQEGFEGGVGGRFGGRPGDVRGVEVVPC